MIVAGLGLSITIGSDNNHIATESKLMQTPVKA